MNAAVKPPQSYYSTPVRIVNAAPAPDGGKTPLVLPPGDGYNEGQDRFVILQILFWFVRSDQPVFA